MLPSRQLLRIAQHELSTKSPKALARRQSWSRSSTTLLTRRKDQTQAMIQGGSSSSEFWSFECRGYIMVHWPGGETNWESWVKPNDERKIVSPCAKQSMTLELPPATNRSICMPHNQSVEIRNSSRSRKYHIAYSPCHLNQAEGIPYRRNKSSTLLMVPDPDAESSTHRKVTQAHLQRCNPGISTFEGLSSSSVHHSSPSG